MQGIYIHIPFCKQACTYCDFHFSTTFESYRRQMIETIVRELQDRFDYLEGQSIETIYFGGGTPSLLSVEEIQLLVNTIYKDYKVVENPEITLEANPDDLMSVRAQSRTIIQS